MKKSLPLFLAVLTAVLITGCASTKIAINDNSPVAIIGIECNPTILRVNDNNEVPEDEGGAVSNSLNKILSNKDIEVITAQDRADYAYDAFVYALNNIAEVEVVDKSVLNSCDEYVYGGGGLFGVIESNNAATGLQKGMLTLGAKKARIIMAETGAKALLSAEFEFDRRTEIKSSSASSVVAVCKMHVRYFDQSGKVVLSQQYITESAKSIKYLNGKYDKEAFVELFPEIIDLAINKFILDFIQ